jgi:uncharacterized protein (TIGR00251 family)
MIARLGREVDDLSMTAAQLTVRVQPRARANEIVGERDGVLLARVTAPPHDGRANEALRRLIARRARVAIGRVSIVRGAASRDKLVRVDGLSGKQLREALLDADRG